jgi:hypothetical protein
VLGWSELERKAHAAGFYLYLNRTLPLGDNGQTSTKTDSGIFSELEEESCYGLDLECAPRSHVEGLVASLYHYWEVMEPLEGVAFYITSPTLL